MKRYRFDPEDEDPLHPGYMRNPQEIARRKAIEQHELAKQDFEFYTWPRIVQRMQEGLPIVGFDVYDVRMFGNSKQYLEVKKYRENYKSQPVSNTVTDGGPSVSQPDDVETNISVEKQKNEGSEEGTNTSTANEAVENVRVQQTDKSTSFHPPLNPDYLQPQPSPLLNEWEAEMEGDVVVEAISEPVEPATQANTQTKKDPLAEERAKINPKSPLTEAQKELFNWKSIRKQFAIANAPVSVKKAGEQVELSWTELDRWIRMALKDGWKEGDKIPLIRDVKYIGDKEGIPRYAALNYDYAFGYARKHSPNGKFWYVNHTTGYEAPIWSGTKLSSNEAGQNYALNNSRQVNFKALSDFVKPEGDRFYADIAALNGQYKAQLYSQSFVELVYLVQMKLFPTPEEASKRTGIYNHETHEQFIGYAENQRKKAALFAQQLKAEELRWATVGEDDGNGYRKYIVEGRTLRINQEKLDEYRKILVNDPNGADEFFEDYAPPRKQDKEDLAFILSFSERAAVIVAYSDEWDVDKEEEEVINLLLRNTPKSQQNPMAAFIKGAERLVNFRNWFDNNTQIGAYETNREQLTGEVNTAPLQEAYDNVDFDNDTKNVAEDLTEELAKLSPGQVKAFEWSKRKNLLEVYLQEKGPTGAEYWTYFAKLFCNLPDAQLPEFKRYLGFDNNYLRMLRLRERTPENQKQQVDESMNAWYANDEFEYYFLLSLVLDNKFKLSYTYVEARMYGLPESVYSRFSDKEKLVLYWFVIRNASNDGVKHDYATGILERIISTAGSGAKSENERIEARQQFYDTIDSDTDINFYYTRRLANTDEKRDSIDQSITSLDNRGRKARIAQVESEIGTPEKGITDSADDKIARLSDEDMQVLGILQRFNLIRAVLGGDGWGRAFTRVGDRDEQTLIRLIKTTPPEQIGALVQLLSAGNGEYYKQVVHAVDGEEYKQLHDTLLQKKQEQITAIPNNAARTAEQRKVQTMEDTGQQSNDALKWDDYSYVGLVFGGSGYEYDVSWTEDGKINVEYSNRNWLDGYLMGPASLGRGIQDAADKETQKGPYNPFDNVAVYAVEDDEELGLYKGQVLVMPAINLFYFQRNQLQGHAMEALDIALLLTGIGEIKAAVSVGRFILAASNIILGSGNIVVRSFGHELPEGWVQSWHSISHKIITFQLLELGLTGIFNARKILIGLRQTASTVANVAKKTLLQMIDVCEQLLDLSERILTTFDELWLGNLLTDLEASMLEFAEYGSLAYFNLKAAIQNRLALLKERAARMAAPKPYEESQLTYRQAGNVEYLDVDLGGGMVVKLKREDGGEWIVSGSKAPPEMYNSGKPLPKWPRDEEVLGRLPERYRRGALVSESTRIINADNELLNAFKEGYSQKSILEIPKGSRPKPSVYLKPEYISNHLMKFDNGASYIVPQSALDNYGRALIGRPDGQFVMSKLEMDNLLSRANGDLTIIETELGIPSGLWKDKQLVRIDIANPSKLNLRMPSGNEGGANELWLPGGKLPKGYSEAVLDQVPQSDYIETLIHIK